MDSSAAAAAPRALFRARRVRHTPPLQFVGVRLLSVAQAPLARRLRVSGRCSFLVHGRQDGRRLRLDGTCVAVVAGRKVQLVRRRWQAEETEVGQRRASAQAPAQQRCVEPAHRTASRSYARAASSAELNSPSSCSLPLCYGTQRVRACHASARHCGALSWISHRQHRLEAVTALQLDAAETPRTCTRVRTSHEKAAPPPVRLPHGALRA